MEKKEVNAPNPEAKPAAPLPTKEGDAPIVQHPYKDGIVGVVSDPEEQLYPGTAVGETTAKAGHDAFDQYLRK